MKWIFLFLVSFNLYSQSIVNCGLDSIEEIEICSFGDKFNVIIKRLYPDLKYKSLSHYESPDPCDPLTVDIESTDEIEICPPWNPKEGYYSLIDQVFNEENYPQFSIYERLKMEQKPEASVFDLELEDWKEEKKEILAFKNSIANLDRLRRRMVKCGFNYSNKEIFKKEIIKNKNIAARDCLQSKKAELDTEDSLTSIEGQVLKDINFGKTIQMKFIVIERIGNSGLSRNERRQKVKRLHLKFNNVKKLLSTGNIKSAKDEFSELQTDADFPQSIKDKILSIFNEYLGE